MARVGSPLPATLIVGAFSGFPGLFGGLRERLEGLYGPVSLESPIFDFPETRHYRPRMGTNLKRIFFGFERLQDQGSLAGIKREAYRLEEDLASSRAFPVARPMNIDPGLLTESRFVLASAKDAGHRVYLGDGIYAEVTLLYLKGSYRELPWTYPEFKRPEILDFLLAVRQRHLEQVRTLRRAVGAGPDGRR